MAEVKVAEPVREVMTVEVVVVVATVVAAGRAEVATVEVAVVALEVVAKPRTPTVAVRVAATRAIARVAVAAALAATVERFRV